MGTSQSSKGPKSKVRLIPSWVENPDIPPEGLPPSNDPAEVAVPDKLTEKQEELELALPARFRIARRDLGNFARSGDDAKLRAGLASYVQSGYRGSETAAQRLANTSATAGRLFNFLSSVSADTGSSRSQPADPRLQPGRSAQDIIDAVIEGIRPVNGTLDAEASRYAIDASLSELLNQYPQADLLALTDAQLELVVELYVARDILFHIELDVGQALRKQGVSALILTDRLRQIQDYVQATVSSAFADLRDQGQVISAPTVRDTTQRALKMTMEVFSQG